jgi:acyl carrier protein
MLIQATRPADKSNTPGQKARDPFEQKFVEIWERFIGRKVNCIDDNYFELGGHSLLAVEIFSELHKVFGIRLPLTVLIEEPKIALLPSISGRCSRFQTFLGSLKIIRYNKTNPVPNNNNWKNIHLWI